MHATKGAPINQAATRKGIEKNLLLAYKKKKVVNAAARSLTVWPRSLCSRRVIHGTQGTTYTFWGHIYKLRL